MGGPLGNNFWTLRHTHGRKLLFQSIDDLQPLVLEWLEEMKDAKLTVQVATSKGVVEVEKPIPLTLRSLCNHLGIKLDTWKDYKKRNGFSDFITRVEQIIYDQKFAYAAIGEFKDNLIARELGLKDSSEQTVVNKPSLEGGKELPSE